MSKICSYPAWTGRLVQLQTGAGGVKQQGKEATGEQLCKGNVILEAQGDKWIHTFPRTDHKGGREKNDMGNEATEAPQCRGGRAEFYLCALGKQHLQG